MVVVKAHRVVYDGPMERPGIDGLWFKRLETWKEDACQMGKWTWVPVEDVPNWAPRAT